MIFQLSLFFCFEEKMIYFETFEIGDDPLQLFFLSFFISEWRSASTVSVSALVSAPVSALVSASESVSASAREGLEARTQRMNKERIKSSKINRKFCFG